jgi:16S rRNA G966 N2-methylase RsmD
MKYFDVKNLELNEEATYSITYPKDHYSLQLYLRYFVNKHYFKKHYFNGNDLILLDATANVGADSIAFVKDGYTVYSIELKEDNFKLLENNVNKILDDNERKMIKIYNDNYLNIYNQFDDVDIVYFDPPWGGKDYMLKSKVGLNDIGLLSHSKIVNCFDILKLYLGKSKNMILCFKLPKNYDFESLFDLIKEYNLKNCGSITFTYHIIKNEKTQKIKFTILLIYINNKR